MPARSMIGEWCDMSEYKLVPVEPTVKELYEEFSQWCSENRGMDFDCRLHTHGGRIEDGGYISHEKTRHAFAAYRAGRKMAMLAAAPAVQMEVVGWQFYQDGKWWNGDDRIKDHKKNTQEAGFRVRDVYAAPQPAEQQPDVTLLLELLSHARCNTCDGSGGLYDNHGNPHQCQWCHDRSKALAAYRKHGGE